MLKKVFSLPIYCPERFLSYILISLSCSLWLGMQLIVPSFSGISHYFGVNDQQVQYVLTANFLGILLGVLVAGALADSLGRRIIFFYGSIGYLLMTLLCALSTNFPLLVAGRFIQGVMMTGPMIASGVILMEKTYGPNQIFWVSIIGSVITFCMAVAPLLGSWIDEKWGFRGNLWGIVVFGMVGFLPAWIFVPESLAPEKKRKFHLATLFKGYRSLLVDGSFISLAIPVCALSGAYWIYIEFSVLYLQDYLHISVGELSLYQGPIIACYSVTSLFASWLFERFGLAACVRLGGGFILFGCLGLLISSFFLSQSAPLVIFFMLFFVAGMAPISAMLLPYVLNQRPPELRGAAQASIQAFRLLMAATGSFILGFCYTGPFLSIAITLCLFAGVSFIGIRWGRKLLDASS